MMHGYGVSKYYDRSAQPLFTYEGYWKYNKKHGKGKMTSHGTGQELDGYWYNDTFSSD